MYNTRPCLSVCKYLFTAALKSASDSWVQKPLPLNALNTLLSECLMWCLASEKSQLVMVTTAGHHCSGGHHWVITKLLSFVKTRSATTLWIFMSCMWGKQTSRNVKQSVCTTCLVLRTCWGDSTPRNTQYHLIILIIPEYTCCRWRLQGTLGTFGSCCTKDTVIWCPCVCWDEPLTCHRILSGCVFALVAVVTGVACRLVVLPVF